jgi:hypothetical protein
MKHIKITGALCLAVLALPILSTPARAQDTLTFQRGDRVVFLGNTYAERMRHYGYFETFLRSRFPDLELTFRNLGWSGDEVNLRPRPMNFGDIHTHLTDLEADVIFLFFGQNESFGGEAGIPDFRQNLDALVKELQGNHYNTESAPRLVLVSPIRQEPIKGMPDVARRNREIGAYTEAMKAVAAARRLPFVDLFDGIPWVIANKGDVPLTFNGIHYEAYGYWVAAQAMLGQLGLRPAPDTILADMASGQIKVVGAALRKQQEVPGGFSIDVEGLNAPYMPVPKGGPEDPPNILDPPLLMVKGLDPGRYGLAFGGVVVAMGTAEEWAKGLPILDTPYQEQLEKARLESVHKNQLFFDRWRAVNGFYIYGGRKEPFGVQSFPPELARFDELVAEEETAINGAMADYRTVTLTFAPVGG